MELKEGREDIIVNKLVKEKTKTIIVEGDIIVPDVKPDILSIINESGEICTYKKECLDGKVKISGGIYLNLIYLADTDENFTRSINTTLDFTQEINIENCKPSMRIKSLMNIKNIESTTLNGRKINVKVTIETKVYIYSNENISILKKIENADDIQTLNTNVKINNLIGTGSTKAVAKDSILLDEKDSLGEILSIDIMLTNKEAKVSYNKVLLKADCNIKIMFLSEQDGKNIKVVNSTVPVMSFIDINNVSEQDILEYNYEIKNILVKPETEQKSIYVEIEFEVECDAINKIDLELIQDMYSPTQKIEFTSKEISTRSDLKKIKKIYSIQSDINMPEITEENLYNVRIIPNLLSSKVLNEKIIYEGELNLIFIYGSGLDINKIEVKKYTTPFTFEIFDDEIKADKKVDTSINLIENNFIIEPNGIIKSTINLEFETTIYNNLDLKIIDNATVKETDNMNSPSIVIYIVKQGDTLWNIAKRYKTTIENIIELNNIENPDNLVVGQKLFIPRYNKLQIA